MSHFDSSKAGSGPNNTRSDGKAAAEARAWADIITKRRDLTSRERKRFEAWLLRAPEHQEELVAAIEIPIRLAELPESERERLRARAASRRATP